MPRTWIPTRSFIPVTALLIGVSALAGCGLFSGDGSPTQLAVFPEAAEQTRTLDIQVFRRGTELVATNTSAIRFGPSRMWLNQEFSRPIDGFGVGETLELELTQFKNDSGKRFRAGGFFATLSPKPVVLVQLQPDGEADLWGLIIVEDEPR